MPAQTTRDRARSSRRLAAVLAALALVAAACAKSEEPEAAPERTHVTLIVAGSFGDESFFDGSLAGVSRASADFGFDYATVECFEDMGRYPAAVTDAAASSDVVVVLGYQLYDILLEVSASYPDIDFIYVDGLVEGRPNVASVAFDETGGSYLAGALAALMTARRDLPRLAPGKRVGLVGGMDIPVIHRFVDGFTAGAKETDPSVEVFVAYAGTFEDREPARKAAAAMYAAGADVVFQAAGGAGLGVFQAARDADRYAIGVDMDQRPLDPARILASMVKDVDGAIYDLLGLAVSGGLEGESFVYGLAEGAVRLEWGGGESPVPEAVRQVVDAIRADIVSGARVVPASR